MYAIVEIAGQQFKVSKDLKVYVHRLSNEEGSKISFDKVLLLDDNGTITLGAPAIEGASVEAKVLQHLKGDKVIIFKKKRRKGYKKRNGHRQYLTQIVIESISATGGKKAAPKAEKAVEAKAPKAAKKGDDLKIIEGIGPKAAEVLVAAGIDTFAKLAKTKAEKINEILDGAEAKVQHLDPTTWPQQAQLAADGKMDELKKLQDELNGGKAV
ncbi:50S ribosomal protein L21 [Flavobacterium psychrophilum]|uniref:Large ribosomal subunit protein bL21 n=2 Tax=Flavobacterium psychrophilum TaxID=96345 RepID=A6H1P9_FLAPJ|nr:50S ribosomal protein L21 [Flavobacterium psychrophilum]AIG30944.1 50S ribosomal protein L21 [Flavobacterium psychrophilum]AIG33221.1 50S ribosomal protein L21 [Flavobacterium psychrophilum]AIG35370.1 50S ribosomal protein L21 [Flavobacterium psychrophilum]AIG37730.1 50S ribosomal protein L21 [Flavobacterium psychrophilum]AIG40002.1 50S ribosomal protein L21 [Flavobacterium psychrophilum]